VIELKRRRTVSDNFAPLDIGRFKNGGMFREAEFRAALRAEDWSKYRGQRVLIKPCGSGPVPPWAFMLVLGELVPYARSVLYGEDCAPIVVWKRTDSPTNRLTS